jgi:hypothetical protein
MKRRGNGEMKPELRDLPSWRMRRSRKKRNSRTAPKKTHSSTTLVE